MVTVLKIDDAKVHLSDTLSMTCDCGVLPWCEHLSKVISSNADSESLWYRLNGESTCILDVQVFPTFSLSMSVRLESISQDMWTVKGNKKKLLNGIESSSMFLGILSPGDGQGVIRSMILAWFLNEIETKASTCAATSHSWKQERILEVAKKDKALRSNHFANQWNIYWTNWCLSCAAIVSDNADLVPDGSPATFSPFAGSTKYTKPKSYTPASRYNPGGAF